MENVAGAEHALGVSTFVPQLDLLVEAVDSLAINAELAQIGPHLFCAINVVTPPLIRSLAEDFLSLLPTLMLGSPFSEMPTILDRLAADPIDVSIGNLLLDLLPLGRAKESVANYYFPDVDFAKVVGEMVIDELRLDGWAGNMIVGGDVSFMGTLARALGINGEPADQSPATNVTGTMLCNLSAINFADELELAIQRFQAGTPPLEALTPVLNVIDPDIATIVAAVNSSLQLLDQGDPPLTAIAPVLEAIDADVATIVAAVNSSLQLLDQGDSPLTAIAPVLEAIDADVATIVAAVDAAIGLLNGGEFAIQAIAPILQVVDAEVAGIVAAVNNTITNLDNDQPLLQAIAPVLEVLDTDIAGVVAAVDAAIGLLNGGEFAIQAIAPILQVVDVEVADIVQNVLSALGALANYTNVQSLPEIELCKSVIVICEFPEVLTSVIDVFASSADPLSAITSVVNYVAPEISEAVTVANSVIDVLLNGGNPIGAITQLVGAFVPDSHVLSNITWTGEPISSLVVTVVRGIFWVDAQKKAKKCETGQFHHP